MAEDNIAIAPVPGSAVPTPVTLVKTFSAIDSNGNKVEIQAISITNEYGRVVDPVTEQTAQKIYNVLCRINNILADAYNTGTRVDIADDI